MARATDDASAPAENATQHPDDLPPDEENTENDSVLDSLSRRMGLVPWWAVSSAFHVVLFVLFILMMTEVPHEGTVVTMKGMDEKQIPPPPEEKQIPPTNKTDVKPLVQLDSTVVTDQTVLPTEVVMENIDQTDDQELTDQRKGDPTFSGTVDLSGYANVGVMGPGGGGGSGSWGGRIGGHKAGLRKHGGVPGIDPAVNQALEWLAKHQEPDGHWDTVKYQAQEAGKCDTAATGLAVLAFLGAGHTDKRGEFKDNVKRALEWMIKQQKPDGCFAPGANGKEASYGPGYHHAICGLAMAEAYGMSRSLWVKDAAQKAVNYSVNVHQDGQGSEKLGWRYQPHTAGDISVSGWFIMQLKDARMAGLAVPQEAFQGGIAFLDSVETKAQPGDPYSGNRYRYQPARPEPTPMQTTIGCTARMFLGWPKEELEPAITWAIEKHGLPSWGANGENVDWYYMYYGTITSFQMGGDLWDKWNKAFTPMLLDHQRKDGDEKGSWDPTGAYANLGRVYSTANGALCLEVFWRTGLLYGPKGDHK